MVGRRLMSIALLLLLVPVAQAATLSAHVDRTSMAQDEILILELTLANSDSRLRAEGEQPNVDLTLLSRDFELGMPREHHRFNIERNRGRATSTLRVELFPRHTGELTVPSFAIDGLRSEVIKVRVLKTTPERMQDLFVRTGVVKDHLWVHETTLLYLDLYHRIDIKSAQLGGLPDTEPRNVELVRVGSRDRTEAVEGIEYAVNRTAWGLAPRQAGTVKVHMPDVWVVTRAGQQRRLPFSDVVVTAKPLPEGTPEGIIVGRPELRIDGLEGAARASTPLAVTLSIRANILPQLLPLAAPTLQMPDGIRIYRGTAQAEAPSFEEDDGIFTTVHYRMQMLPSRGGRFQLPAITLPYFDNVSGQLATTSIDESILDVTAPPKDDHAVSSPLPEGGHHRIGDSGPSAVTWQLISLGLFLLWIGTLLTVWWTRRSPPLATQPPSRQDLNSGTPGERLLRAMGTRTLEAGLQRWETQLGIDQTRRDVVRAVQQARYAGKGSDTESALHSAVDQVLKHLPKIAAKQDQEPLDPWCPEHFVPTAVPRPKPNGCPPDFR